ncbi:MAG: hypothetical protein LR011_11910 [Verrucomicrobia bacterium]|nr:hypothetical protein [Verrucomicrobiota bacterium]
MSHDRVGGRQSSRRPPFLQVTSDRDRWKKVWWVNPENPGVPFRPVPAFCPPGGMESIVWTPGR